MDFDKAVKKAFDDIGSWLPEYSAGKSRAGERWLCSPLRADKNPTSFSINETSGLWFDLATYERGNPLQLYAKIKGIDIMDAAKHFLEPTLEPIPQNIPLCPATQGYSQRYDYGHFLIYRYETPQGKTFMPWYFDGTKWINKKPEMPIGGYNLFNLKKIIADKKAVLVLVEGEKAALSVPSPYIGVSWSSGANAYEKTNFTPLNGRKIIIWPDNDEVGIKAMEAIKSKLKNCDIQEVLPCGGKGGDCADFKEIEILEKLSTAYTIVKKEPIFPLVAFDDLTLTPPKWIIKGLLTDHSFGCIFGASGSGKSYVALDMAASIVTGTSFCKKQIKKQGAVVYIAGEGHSGLAHRLRAWELRKKVSLKGAPLYISKRACALGDDDFMQHVKESVDQVFEKHGEISLIIVDTWARNLFGNENDTAETGAAIRALDELKDQYKCSSLVIHHSGHTETGRGRGSSALRAALDMEYSAELDGNILSLKNTKMKEGQKPDDITFSMNHIPLGFQDEDGEEVVSTALDFMDIQIAQTGKAGRPAKNQDMIIDALKEHPEGIQADKLFQVSRIMKHDSFKAAKKSLILENKIKCKEDKYFLVEKEDG